MICEDILNLNENDSKNTKQRKNSGMNYVYASFYFAISEKREIIIRIFIVIKKTKIINK